MFRAQQLPRQFPLQSNFLKGSISPESVSGSGFLFNFVEPQIKPVMKQVLQSLLLLTLAVLLLGCKRNKPVVSEDREGDLISSATVLAKAETNLGEGPFVNVADPVFKSYLLGEVVYSVKESAAGVDRFDDTAYSATAQPIDANGDGEISIAEAERVVFLKVEGLDIESFVGLESFPNLAGLVIKGIDSPCLNLSGNAKLKHLVCSSNNLTAIDLSQNRELTYLYCTKNQLATLDLSNNVALKVLRCDDNRLSSLDLSKNVELTRLFCGNNQLAALDISNNVALEYADCSSNRLSALDVSGNAMLASLYCDYNPLTEIFVPAGHCFKHLSMPETATTIDK